MQTVSIKAVVATLWISTVAVGAIAGKVSSIANWAVLAGVAAFPPLVVSWWWNEPRQTMSEIIQEARG